jgi:DMSO/TMAO reductase YedYZ molybdopterin-dependent catalytic subunit
MNWDKLIAVKERWAQENRLIVPEPPPLAARADEPSSPKARKRLPPGQHLVRDWPVLEIGPEPAIHTDDWRLTVGGLVGNPCELDWRRFGRLPQTETLSDIHCVTGWSRYDNRWRGVSTAELLNLARPSAAAKFVIMRSYDSYSTTLPIEDFGHADALLATHWEGEPLARSHGGPVRVIAPHLYLWKSAKWLRHIWFTDNDAPGYWEARGYHKRGDPWRQQRYKSNA